MAKYKAYSEYKDSGVEWLGAVPNDWHIIKLKYMADLLTAKPSHPDELFVGLENISSGDGKYISKEETIADCVAITFKKNDILFGKLRPYLAKSWLATFSGVCSSEFLVLRTVKSHPKFLNYYSLTNKFIEQVNSSTYGSKMPRASWEFIGLLPVPTCSYTLSEKIATFLNYETAKIDNLIEKQQQLIELLKEKRQAVISHAVTKGLNPDVPMKDSGIEWLDSIPSSWEVKPTYAICSASTEKNTDGLENNVLSLSYGNIIKRKTDTNFGLLPDSFNTYQIVKDGDIILRLTDLQNDKNSLRVGLVTQSGIITPAYLKLSVKHAITPSFSYYLLHTYDIFKVFYGMGGGLRQSMKFEDFRRLPLLIPSKIEQESIVTFIDKRIIKIDILIEKQLQQIALLKERRTALISAAVTGKIDVRHWRAPNEQTTDEAEAAQ
ncbi:restriction endonuclease subunit S [Citrobacter sp. Cpo142]|jgi:type I restriction enzyme S subunit|uniref:restriction endonuclease subunit S n=1 Tax=Citrobacter TaxID=544 RepID=UPI0025769D08|nr:restriction endonuclease subunit S [Citrobacter sp. Cpo142]MDM2779809.1 restriction endonuclease subunit S [Citrobacter sp. Cpo142]